MKYIYNADNTKDAKIKKLNEAKKILEEAAGLIRKCRMGNDKGIPLSESLTAIEAMGKDIIEIFYDYNLR